MKTILIVDDDPLVLMNHSDILEDAGYLVIPASSVREASNLTVSRTFDLIVCDHDLGDGKGMDFLRSLIERGIRIPAVYLSAAGAKILTLASMLETVKAVISKPVSKDALLEAVEHAFPQENAAARNERYPRLIGDQEREDLFNSIF